MAAYHRWCRYYDESYSFCGKYSKTVHISNNPYHDGLLLHPLDFVSLYYQRDVNAPSKLDIGLLVNLADEFLDSDIDKNIVACYRRYGKITYKQRKTLTNHLLYCAEEKPSHEYTVGPYCYQVE